MRIEHLRELDGLSIKDAARMPHPADLAEWSRRGWYTVDAERGVFRLTDAGRALAPLDMVRETRVSHE